MTPEKRIEQLEATVRKVWGVLLIADEIMARGPREDDRRYIRAAFAAVDEECKKTGLLAREGMAFVELKPEQLDLVRCG